MGRPRRIPAKESVIAAASLCVVAVLPGCSAVAPSVAPSAADPPAPTAVHSTADPMAHFLAGQGTGVHYRAGSPIARKARASEAFRALNADVQNAVLGQLK